MNEPNCPRGARNERETAAVAAPAPAAATTTTTTTLTEDLEDDGRINE